MVSVDYEQVVWCVPDLWMYMCFREDVLIFHSLGTSSMTVKPRVRIHGEKGNHFELFLFKTKRKLNRDGCVRAMILYL